MKLAFIGVGQAGGKIVDRLLEQDATADGPDVVEHALAINTAETDLGGLSHVPTDDRLLIGQTEVGGHGVGGDSELAATIAEEELDEIYTALSPITVHRVDAFMIVAGLGGGTGGGAAPLIARHLQDLYEQPVYGLGVLPATDEGGIYTLNAARSLQTIVEHVDNLILFDNESWRTAGEAVDAGFQEMNAELVTQLEPIFRAGETGTNQDIAESVVDTSEIINTLSSGGISSVGYAADTSIDTVNAGSQGLLARFTRTEEPETDSVEATNRITSLVRKATRGRLTLPIEVSSTEQGLVVVAGPSEYLNRKGIEQARTWLEEETGSMHIRGGDYPWSREVVSVSILLAGAGQADRLQRLKHQAVKAQENLETMRGQHDEAMAELSDEQLDSLL